METTELQELFENVEDPTDPKLMDFIEERFDEIQLEDEEFMELLLRKLEYMVVTWHQPWYQKVRSLTVRVPPIIPQGENVMFRTDKITLDESKKINKNWRRFRKMFNVPNKPLCFARWRNKERSCNPFTPVECVRRFVVSFLAQGLERTLNQVYRYVRANYGGPVQGKLRRFEKNLIEVCFYNAPNKTGRYMTAILRRQCRNIYMRMAVLFYGKPEKKVLKWNLPLATKFLKLLIQHSGETVLNNLKQRHFEKSVWLKIQDDLDQRAPYLQHFWYDKLHVQLFVKVDVKLKRLRRKIFQVLKLYPYKIWSDIRWPEVAEHFPDGFTFQFLNKICYTFVYSSYPGFLKKPLEDVINHAIKKTKFSQNRRLKTLIFNKNQELEYIKYENKLKLIF